MFINITPFAHSLHHNLTLGVFALFVISCLYTWTAFPFTREAPLKLWFVQTIEVDLPASVSGVTLPASQSDSGVRAITQLSGPKGILQRDIIPGLPSSWGQDVNCLTNPLRPGLTNCNWTSTLFPSPGGESATDEPESTPRPSDWLDVNITRLGLTSARISVQGKNTRNCRIKFDSPISSFTVHPPEFRFDSSGIVESYPSGRIQPGYEITEKGLNDLVLFSRTWGRRFVVDIGWNETTGSSTGGDEDKFGGRVGCQWSEYGSASAGSSYAATSAQVPAMEELLHFLPLWATVTKVTYGVVEVEGRFSI